MKPTPLFETYWRFIAERQRIYVAKNIERLPPPWTDDRIISEHRFTNVFRVTDRVSQYLVREVQYGDGRSQEPRELFFRTMLFKFFNKIETWELLERAFGMLAYDSGLLMSADLVLDQARKTQSIYSAAYIIPSPLLVAEKPKHTNHLRLLDQIMTDGTVDEVLACRSLEELYNRLLKIRGLGSFLAFQAAVDLSYSAAFDFDDSGFVVAGPGAIDGISKCFEEPIENGNPEELIMHIAEQQETCFEVYGIAPVTLFGRRLQPIDIQNCFCEISKYTRVSNPEVKGASGRTTIKQRYRRSERANLLPFLPPKWNVAVPTSVERDVAIVQPTLDI